MSLASSRKVTKGDENGVDPWSVNYYWDGTKWVVKNSDTEREADTYDDQPPSE